MATTSEKLLVNDKTDDLEYTSVRIHETALKLWLAKAFPLNPQGYPVPSIFSTPKDAHSEFTRLFAASNNPFAYLLKIKNPDGSQVYNPVPSAPFYPLITIKRINWRLRPSQAYGYRINRINYFPTPEAATTPGVTLNNLTTVAQTGWPVGWDFRFQIDHYCKNIQTQAVFVNRVQRQFRFAGGSAQRFIPVQYPFPNFTQKIRMYLESDIEDSSEEGSQDRPQERRTTFTVVLEGFWMNYVQTFRPALWYVGVGATPLTDEEAQNYFDFNSIYPGLDDLRKEQTNPVIESRPGLPPAPTA